MLEGTEQLAAPMRPNFNRPPIDNDLRGRGAKAFGASRKAWGRLPEAFRTVSVDARKEGKAVTVVARQEAEKVACETTYAFPGDGSVVVTLKLEADPSLPDLSRIGMTLGVPAALAVITSYSIHYTKLYDTTPARRAGW